MLCVEFVPFWWDNFHNSGEMTGPENEGYKTMMERCEIRGEICQIMIHISSVIWKS